MITKLTALALALLAGGFAGAAPAATETSSNDSGFTFTLDREAGVLDLAYHGRKVLVYAFATNQFKPYVRALYTLAGDNVLLDAPPDHLHHHGLMYAIRVNGHNFWEERDQPGHEKPVLLLPPRTGRSEAGLPQASFTQVIHWLAHQDAAAPDSSAAALLVERRTLTLTVDEKLNELALDWHADFEVGRGAQMVTLAGANYHGLGLRLPPAFNLVAQHQNSELAPYLTQGTGDVTPAKWSSVSHTVQGHDITVALFGRPTASGKLPFFFTMVKPFTYLAVTQGLDRAPLQYSSGAPFSLDYRLVVYAEHRGPEFLNQRYALWNQR